METLSAQENSCFKVIKIEFLSKNCKMRMENEKKRKNFQIEDREAKVLVFKVNSQLDFIIYETPGDCCIIYLLFLVVKMIVFFTSPRVSAKSLI